jgi:hypothetical protein
LETIRQFAEDQLAATGTIDAVRDRHARWFADQAVAQWELWDSPRHRVAVDWADVEFDNLRTGFRWATDRGDVVAATAIAAHTTMMAFTLQRYEPVGWAEELLPAATTADVVQLPRLYTAASFCSYTGRPEVAVGYAQTAVGLESDPRYQPFEPGGASGMEALAHLLVGRIDRWLEIYTDLATRTGYAHIVGLCGLIWGLAATGRDAEARAIADETLAAARAHGNPFLVAYAFSGCGRAFGGTDPVRALATVREGLVYAREHRQPFFEANIAREAAVLEVVHGDLETGLRLFDTAIETLHQAGNIGQLALTLADLAVFFDRFGRPDIAATIYGTTTHHAGTVLVADLPAVVDHLRTVLGETRFDECVATGAARELADAVQYAREQIRLIRSDSGVSA